MKYLRPPVAGERVRVYYNLHKSVWSVQDTKGRVIAHLPELTLIDVSWVVRPAGRAKVLEIGKKNVHAFGVGRFVADLPRDIKKLWLKDKIRYSPFRAGHFFNQEGIPVHNSKAAYFESDRQVYADG